MSDQTVGTSVNGLIEEALQTLTPAQRWAVERNFKRHPENRDKLVHAVEFHMANTNPALMATMDADGFGPNTIFQTDVAGKGELLQIIIDNLPAILAAIIKIIGLFGMMLLAVMVLGASPAMAQYVPSYGSSGSAAVQSYGSNGSSVASYGSSGSASKAYGSTGSAAPAAASYGCAGSAVAKDSRPLRSILENKPLRNRVRATLDGQPVRSRVAAVASVAAAIPASVGNAYQVALASAQYRAANGIRNHSPIERGHRSGVGFSTFNPNPTTCLGVGGNYAVVRGSDGWYSTKIE